MKRNTLASVAKSASSRAALSVLLVTALLTQLGCDRKAAGDVALLGLETSKTLTLFYETLAKTTNDTWDMELYWIAQVKTSTGGAATPAPSPCVRTSTPAPNAAPPGGASRAASLNFTDEDIADLKERVDALNSRVAMAKQMVDMYTALKDYAAYDSGAQIEAAATKLSGALQALVPLPGIDPSAIVGGVAGDLARWNQFRSLKEKTRISMELNAKIKELFQRESTAYTFIMRDNSTTATAVAQELINNEMVLPWVLLDNVPATFGVKWATVTNNAPPKDPNLKCGFIDILRRRNDRLGENAKNATENMGKALDNLIAEQQKFLNKKPLSLSNVSAFLGRAKFYLDEIEKQKTAFKEAKEKTNGQ